MSTPIEIEFACNLHRSKDKKPEFSLLQIRPIVSGLESDSLSISEDEKERAIVLYPTCHGKWEYRRYL